MKRRERWTLHRGAGILAIEQMSDSDQEPQDLEATVERCREGDEDAWSALVSATLRPIYRLCASYAPSAAEAEELTQEVFFKLWENLHRYHSGSNFMAWAWRVARNLLIDAHRRSRRGERRARERR